jgi:hypothetical protein
MRHNRLDLGMNQDVLDRGLSDPSMLRQTLDFAQSHPDLLHSQAQSMWTPLEGGDSTADFTSPAATLSTPMTTTASNLFSLSGPVSPKITPAWSTKASVNQDSKLEDAGKCPSCGSPCSHAELKQVSSIRVGSLNFIRSAEHQAFFNHLDKTGSFFT